MIFTKSYSRGSAGSPSSGSGGGKGTLTDSRDGKEYNTVEIGSQTWMAENLNYNVAGIVADVYGVLQHSKSNKLYKDYGETPDASKWKKPEVFGKTLNLQINFLHCLQ